MPKELMNYYNSYMDGLITSSEFVLRCYDILPLDERKKLDDMRDSTLKSNYLQDMVQDWKNERRKLSHDLAEAGQILSEKFWSDPDFRDRWIQDETGETK